ncbi:MAG: response regulator [Spirochaeta sp.]|nr:response regulator [Spirochaeta sp.]
MELTATSPIRFNDAVNEPAGYTHEEFAALSYWDVTPTEYMPEEQAQLESMKQTGRYGPFLKEYMRKDGSRYPVMLHGFKFTTPEGREVIWSIVQDISEQQAAEHALRTSKERFGGIFEQTSSGVAVYRSIDDGTDFEFVDYNAAAARMDRKEQGSVIGHRLTECFPGIRDMGLFEVLQRVSRTGEPEQLPLSQYEDDDITGWRENRVFRLSSGEIVAVYDDLTGIKKAQQESERARQEAEQASRAKSEFLANMSHEIRTPMNAVIGLSQLLTQTELNDQQKSHAHKIYSSSQMLLRIINDILDFSKIESGKLELEERSFSLSEIVDQMSTLFGEAAHTRQLELLFDVQPDIPQSFMGDSLRLSQVLTNLLSNATKFTDPGGVVELGIRAAEPESNGRIALSFSVRDTGIGISTAEADRLFRPFTQVDASTTRRHGGTGLGLVISRRLVEKMGGELKLDSEPGEGSTFAFTLSLPISTEDAHAVGCPMLQGGRVLIVDDQAAARELMHDLLYHCGITTEEAESGEAAIDKVVDAERRGEAFDFILMDFMMPGGMNGAETFEALEQMRRDGQLSQTRAPILMVSAYQKDEIKLPEGLITDFLPKPVTASSVYNALMRAESGERFDRRWPAIQTPIPGLNGNIILLVEDNETNREVAGLLIEKTGARIRTAENGVEALESVSEESPDLILMDLQMPVMDGFEATRQLRKEGYTGPVIALSAAVMDDDRKEAAEAGMTAHIGKPIESEQLYATLVEHLGGFATVAASAASAAAPVAATQSTAPAGAAPVGPSVLPESLPGFDLARGLRQLGGDDALYLRQLKLFGSKLRRDYAPLLEHLRNNDIEAARQVAHALKGAAGTLSAVELQRIAEQIDQTLAQGMSVNSSVVDALEQALNAAEQALATLRQPNDAGVTGTADALEKLHIQLEKNELVAEATLQEAVAYLRGRGYDCEALEEQVVQMEFDAALKTLTAMMNTEDGAAT